MINLHPTYIADITKLHTTGVLAKSVNLLNDVQLGTLQEIQLQPIRSLSRDEVISRWREIFTKDTLVYGILMDIAILIIQTIMADKAISRTEAVLALLDMLPWSNQSLKDDFELDYAAIICLSFTPLFITEHYCNTLVRYTRKEVV